MCGSYLDGLGNHVTVYAHTNPGPTGQQPAALHDQMPGWGTIRFKKASRTVVFECWPRWADPVTGPQYAGWPFEVPQLLNGGRRNEAYLPELRISGMRNPVLQVIDSFTWLGAKGMMLPSQSSSANTAPVASIFIPFNTTPSSSSAVTRRVGGARSVL